MTITNQSASNHNKLVISIGDPCGIGTEITLKALASTGLPNKMEPLLVGCKKHIIKTYLELKSKGIVDLINPTDIEIENIPLEADIVLGKPSKISGAASFKWVFKSINIILQKQGKALVTAPIAKDAWNQAGYNYSGQTELLAELTGCKTSMLFTAISPKNGWRFNTLLATTHIPFQQISHELNESLLHAKLDALLKFCTKFKPKPTIGVAGLNPHAGENGNLGVEEITWIIPALEKWQKLNQHARLLGPMPPDSCWISASNAWQGKIEKNTPDGILALYHDQGLIPVKLIAFDSAINTTLGIPFVRTSPDHGTAFDIAGQGIARKESMLNAIKEAWNFSNENK